MIVEIPTGRDADTGFDRALERVARVLATQRFAGSDHDYVRAVVEHEIALALAHMDQVRTGRRDAREVLIHAECDIGTELAQMDADRWWYRPNREERWRDRQHLKARLTSLENDRVRTDAMFAQQLRALEERLLVLVHRHRAVEGTNEKSGGSERSE